MTMAILNDLLCDFLMKDFHLRVNFWRSIVITGMFIMYKCRTLNLDVIINCTTNTANQINIFKSEELAGLRKKIEINI